MNEHEITELMERAGSGMEPDVAGLIAGGAARGRVRRRRRRSGVALGAVALAGVTVLGLGVAPGVLGDDRDGVAGGVAGVPTSTSAPETEVDTSGPRRFGPDPEAMGRVLAQRIGVIEGPDGRPTRRPQWHVDSAAPDDFQAGSVLLDGALVTILLERTEFPGCGEQPPGAACDVVPGGYLTGRTYEEPTSGGGPTAAVSSTATYVTDDGFTVTASAWNALSEKDDEPIWTDPVLSEQQLAELAQDSVWIAGER